VDHEWIDGAAWPTRLRLLRSTIHDWALLRHPFGWCCGDHAKTWRIGGWQATKVGIYNYYKSPRIGQQSFLFFSFLTRTETFASSCPANPNQRLNRLQAASRPRPCSPRSRETSLGNGSHAWRHGQRACRVSSAPSRRCRSRRGAFSRPSPQPCTITARIAFPACLIAERRPAARTIYAMKQFLWPKMVSCTRVSEPPRHTTQRWYVVGHHHPPHLG
jgi:hypothetical protein